MSVNRDFDDIARAWLDLMPDEAPERLIADVLQAVEAVPQSRRRIGWPIQRMTHMKSSFLAIGAAAVVVVAGAVALARPGGPAPIGATPTTTPSGVATSTPAASADRAASAAAGLPTAIQHVWLGGNNSFLSAGTGAALVVGSGSIAITAANDVRLPVLTATTASLAADQIQVVGSGASARCDASQTGVYAWSLTPSGRALTLRAVNDPCAARLAALSSTWLLVACQEPTDNCLGPIDAGTYVSQFVNFRHPTTGWTPNLGAITYTVPDGWANTGDWPDHFELVPMASFGQATGPNGPDHLIDITADVRAESAATPCSGKPATAGTTPAAIIASLRTIPGLVVGPATSITIDGKTGRSVDLTVDPAKLRPCGSDQVVEFLVGHTTMSGLLSGSSDRLILLPMESSTVAIEIVAPTTDFDAFAASAMPIVNSLKLH